ncbi:urate hydroxylase PuuD [Marinicella sediminis]|uniref:Urate hydroxylase PuuD n=1 Tax=Marinicella sediminis TaxID=1792834 RepID=A0ABV7JHS0_9GAMM|nr:urate hydroxylase PuuD [Marinicella sediminis]
MDNVWVDLLARWGHGLFGITWIGLLYYFNFVQGEYFKEAAQEALPDVKAKLATRALWWFRWGAMMTFITGVVLLGVLGASVNGWILLGALLGTFMMLNVWLVIWPNQKVVLGLTSGDVASCAAKAGLASRTNTLFSAPMLFCMLASKHGAAVAAGMIPVTSGWSNGLLAALALAVVIELNALFGKMGPMASVKGVIHLSLVLTAVMVGLVVYL